MSFAWKGFHSFSPSFKPSFTTSLTSGVSPVAAAVFTGSTYATNLAALSSVATFSRAGNAMQFDSQGYLTYGPNNLLTYSNTFSNAAWIKINASVSNANAVSDPFGGNTASTLTATANNGQVFQNAIYTNASTTNGVASLWIKRRTGSGAITLYRPDGSNTTVPAVTGAWTQFASTGVGGAGVFGFSIQFATSGDAVDIYNATISAVTYETTPRTVDQVITTSAAYYGPRFDYNPNTLAVKGLLIEEARTNYCPYSSALSSWSPTNGTVTNNSGATLDPSGLNTATLVNPTGGSNTFLAPPAFTASGSTQYTASYFVKSAGAGFVQIAFYDGTNALLYVAGFNLSTGANVSTTAGVTALPSVNVGNGWWRLSATWTSASNTATIIPVVYPKSDAGGASPALSDKIYVWGPQYEKGAATSSYVANSSTGTTARAAETVQLTGAALAALQGASGTAIVEYMATSTTQSGAGRIIGTTSPPALLYGYSDTVVASWNGSRSLNATIGSSGKFSTIARTGVSWSAAGTSLVGNGGTVATDANTAFGGVTPVTAYLASESGSTNFENGWYRSFAIYTSRLPDATLQARSVVGASY